MRPWRMDFVDERRTGGQAPRRNVDQWRNCVVTSAATLPPTFAAQHVSKVLGIAVGRDTVRKWMIAAGLWQSRKRKVATIHQWRQRCSCFGELVQWDTSDHDWLEGRGERLYLIAMIDDDQPRVCAVRAAGHGRGEHARVQWCAESSAKSQMSHDAQIEFC